jgi:hypothetical protein
LPKPFRTPTKIKGWGKGLKAEIVEKGRAKEHFNPELLESQKFS